MGGIPTPKPYPFTKFAKICISTFKGISMLSIKSIINFIKVVLCKHDDSKLKFIRNIGGDEMLIYYVKNGLAKSEWLCNHCGRVVHKNFRVGE